MLVGVQDLYLISLLCPEPCPEFYKQGSEKNTFRQMLKSCL